VLQKLSEGMKILNRSSTYAAILKRFDTNLTCPWMSGRLDDMAIADLNNDGRQDLILTGPDDYRYANLYVMLQKTDGSLAPAATYNLPTNDVNVQIPRGSVIWAPCAAILVQREPSWMNTWVYRLLA